MCYKEQTREQIAVMQACIDGKEIEWSFRGYPKPVWKVVDGNPMWDWNKFQFRIAPPRKPSIDWSHVSSEYKWMARDENGRGYFYDKRPLINKKGYWKPDCSTLHDSAKCVSAEGFASYKPGSCDWKDSLVERPDDE